MLNQLNSSKNNSSYARKFRKFIINGLPFISAQLIITVMLYFQALSHLSLIVLGFLLVEISVLMFVNQIIPSERRYYALRAETDHFLKLVRRLNTTALRMKRTDVPNYHREFEEIQQEMKCSVDRMGTVAGKTNEELETIEPDIPVRAVQNDG